MLFPVGERGAGPLHEALCPTVRALAMPCCFLQGERPIDRPVPIVGAEQSPQAGMGEVSGATSLLCCLQSALSRFELLIGKSKVKIWSTVRGVKDEPRHVFAGNHCVCSQGIFSFWFHFMKSVQFWPGAAQNFSINTSVGSAGAEQGVCTCALSSSRAAHVGYGPGRGE